MHLSEERIYYLLKSYTDGVSNKEEERELYAWVNETQDGSEIKRYIAQLVDQQEGTFQDVDWDDVYIRIKDSFPKTLDPQLTKRNYWFRVAAALLILVLGAGATYWFSNRSAETPPLGAAQNIVTYSNDIKPGSTKAVLQTGEDQVILSGNDTSFTLSGNRVQVDNGRIHTDDRRPVKYTLTVPRGGTYSLVLSDGTKVWLNADSRMVYPSVFKGANREVELTGEAYFEVESDVSHPFIVKLYLTKEGQGEVKVLGTSFNIQSYREDGHATMTLVSGKVQVFNRNRQMVLLPGQRVLMDPKGHLDLEQDVDIDQVVAWKNGYFHFDGVDIHTVMDKLARWYNIKVNYSNDLPTRQFGAIISRNNNISRILKMLEATGDVHFDIAGNEVTVRQ